MTQENGYFQIELSNGMSILHIFPPMGSGEPADFDEIVRYLNARGYSELPLREIKENICNNIKSEEYIWIFWFYDVAKNKCCTS